MTSVLFLASMSLSFMPISTLASTVVDFNYQDRGPNTWWFFHPGQCDDLLFPLQSPITLSSSEALVGKMEAVKMENYEVRPTEAELINDGTAAVLRLSGDERPILSGGPLIPGEKYVLDHVLWHWGENETVGGEHLLDGRTSPGEMQLVHYNSARYGSYEEALQFENGVVILAFQFSISATEPNPAYESLPWFAVQDAGRVAEVLDLSSVAALLPPGVTAANQQFFSYHGSLTRPPCSNTVTWVVFTARVEVSHEQMDQFRDLRDVRGERIRGNYRGLQKVSGRRPIFRLAAVKP